MWKILFDKSKKIMLTKCFIMLSIAESFWKHGFHIRVVLPYGRYNIQFRVDPKSQKRFSANSMRKFFFSPCWKLVMTLSIIDLTWNMKEMKITFLFFLVFFLCVRGKGWKKSLYIYWKSNKPYESHGTLMDHEEFFYD